jgi:uncharacterized Zn finger protein (UPF0148 family)
MPDLYMPGATLVSYCPKCKMGLAHTVVAMDGEKTAQVTCTTCGSTHPFKPPADGPKPRASRAKKRTGTPPSVTASWEARMATASGEEHVYTMGATYRIGDIVLHAQFGKGVVLKLSTNKCTMLFQDKERLMASAN